MSRYSLCRLCHRCMLTLFLDLRSVSQSPIICFPCTGLYCKIHSKSRCRRSTDPIYGKACCLLKRWDLVPLLDSHVLQIEKSQALRLCAGCVGRTRTVAALTLKSILILKQRSPVFQGSKQGVTAPSASQRLRERMMHRRPAKSGGKSCRSHQTVKDESYANV